MGILCGYLVGTPWPNFMSASNPGPAFMVAVAVIFSFVVAYIAYRGVNGSTSINIAINVIQISALLVFSVMALGYRMNHPVGSVAYQFDATSGDAYTYEFATEKQQVNGQPADVVLRDDRREPAGHLRDAAVDEAIVALLELTPGAGKVCEHSSDERGVVFEVERRRIVLREDAALEPNVCRLRRCLPDCFRHDVTASQRCRALRVGDRP
jgi:hypothetical protein